MGGRGQPTCRAPAFLPGRPPPRPWCGSVGVRPRSGTGRNTGPPEPAILGTPLPPPPGGPGRPTPSTHRDASATKRLAPGSRRPRLGLRSTSHQRHQWGDPALGRVGAPGTSHPDCPPSIQLQADAPPRSPPAARGPGRGLQHGAGTDPQTRSPGGPWSSDPPGGTACGTQPAPSARPLLLCPFPAGPGDAPGWAVTLRRGEWPRHLPCSSR